MKNKAIAALFLMLCGFVMFLFGVKMGVAVAQPEPQTCEPLGVLI